jgi:hypothetical protein
MEVNEVNEVVEKEIDYKDVNFLARFACLYEGVNIACDKAEQLGIDPDKSTSWIKPLAFQKYIKDRERDMKYQIEHWNKNKKCAISEENL